jgi:hypothetical protein
VFTPADTALGSAWRAVLCENDSMKIAVRSC